MVKITMRPAIAMIELIFAIVIIAITVMSIPSMMSVAAQASKGMVIDDDVLKRMSGEMIKIFPTRWDGNHSLEDNVSIPILWIKGQTDLNCSHGGPDIWHRINYSTECDKNYSTPTAIPVIGTGILPNGLEQINGVTDSFEINTTDTSYTVPVTYKVSYVDSSISPIDSSSNTVSAVWILGSSTNMNPNPTGVSHLKRVVARCNGSKPEVDMTLTFFKSNIGMANE